MKHRLYQKIICLFLCTILVLPCFLFASFAENANFPIYPDEITSKAALVIDADSSFILYEKSANERMYPASLAKVMTAIVVMEKSNGNYDDMVNFSYNAVTRDIDRASATIGASAGDQLSVRDCLYSLLLPSANDVANALAEYVAGSISDFALLMNEKAQNLGCTNTNFVNPSGLHDDNQYTSALDMAKILQYALTFPLFTQISSSVSYRHAPIRRYKNPENSNNQVLNTNGIVVPGSGYYYNGITSGKTGHTSLAGYNLAASARRHNMNIICVLLGGKTDKIRYNEAKALFDYYFNNYESPRIKDVDPRFKENLGTIAINSVDLVDTLDITCSDSAHITIPNGTNYQDVVSELSFQVEDMYDKYAIGTIRYYLDGILVGKCSVRGINADLSQSIFTGNLDLSTRISDNDNAANNSNNSNEITNNALIYRNSSGTLVISPTLSTLFVIIIAMIVSISLFVFLYLKVFTNSNFPIRKIIFRLKRRFKR